jgi:hypothetical protein
MLYALQIAASNLKRLHEETSETTNAADMANEKSLMKEFLEVLQIPETEAERMAEEATAEEERKNPPSQTHTIKAVADAEAHSPLAHDQSHRFDIKACVAAPEIRARGRAHSSTREARVPHLHFVPCASPPNPSPPVSAEADWSRG